TDLKSYFVDDRLSGLLGFCFFDRFSARRQKGKAS
ncbi:MAG: hypothetical protein ACI8UZ_002517, partial [Akkermansiaceae bacterium]